MVMLLVVIVLINGVGNKFAADAFLADANNNVYVDGNETGKLNVCAVFPAAMFTLKRNVNVPSLFIVLM